jgi:acyl dehydratase
MSVNPNPTNKYNAIETGDSFTFSREITADMVDAFAKLSGDYNPVHMDEAYCARQGLGSRIVHGMLVLSLVSTLIGMYLPGEGAIWLSQSFDFISPARIGDILTVSGRVTDKRSNGMLGLNLLYMKVEIHNEHNMKVARGKATVKI